MKNILIVLFVILGSLLFPDASNELVVLIHGLRGDATDMQELADFLRDNNYDTTIFTYPSTDYKIQILAEKYLKLELSTQIIKHPPKIHFVTHSMGGIVLRSYLENHLTEIDSILGRIVMLAPPNKGSEVTEFFMKTDLYEKRYGISGQQLGFDISYQVEISDSVSYKPGIIAGTDTQFPYFSWFIKGSDDGKISIPRTKIKGMGDFIEMHFPHDTIMKKKEVAEQVLYYIQNDEFKE